MNIQPNVLIFSTFNAEFSEHLNGLNHNQVMSAFKARHIPFVELETKTIDGLIERQLLVVGFENTDLVEKYARTFGQDSYLKSHGDRFTEKISLNEIHAEPVGYIRAISEVEATLKGTYTLNRQTGTYYSLEERP